MKNLTEVKYLISRLFGGCPRGEYRRPVVAAVVPPAAPPSGASESQWKTLTQQQVFYYTP